MKLRYKILLILIVLAFVTSLFVGQSYALWVVTKSQKNKNNLNSGCFSVTFDDKGGANAINLTNAAPTQDTTVLNGNTQPYTFTITNTCSIQADYTISLNSLNIANAIDDSKVKFAIYDTSKPSVGTLLTQTPNSDTKDLEVDNLKKSYVATTGTLAPTGQANASKTYSLYMWIDYSAGSEVQNKSFQAAVRVMSRASGDMDKTKG